MLRIAHLFGDCDNGGASGEMDYDNGIWQHVLKIPRVPLEKKLTDQQIGLWCKNNNIDVLICTMWGTFVSGTGKAQRGCLTLKQICPDLKVIGLVDEPLLTDFASRFGGSAQHMKISQGYMDGLGDFDAIFTICDSELEFYESFNSNVYNMGLPFPDGAYETLVRKDPRPEKKDKIWIGLGVGGNAFTRWERNYGVALAAFEKAVAIVRKNNAELADRMQGIMLSWTEKSDRAVIQHIKDRYQNVFIQMRSDMQSYLHFLQSCDAVIAPTLRDTPGRLVGECAYFGIPCFGSNVPDLQAKLFAELTSKPFDVNSYAEGVAGLVLAGSKEKYCGEDLKNARETLIGLYGVESTRNKFKAFLKAMGWGEDWYEVGVKKEVLL